MLKGHKDRSFVNEHPTKKRNELYFETIKLVKKGKIKQTWTHDGRILIRNNDDKVQPMKSLSDITPFNQAMAGWTPYKP